MSATTRRRLGSDHPNTLAARGALAEWRGEAGDPAAAAESYAELLADSVRILGRDHPETLAVRYAPSTVWVSVPPSASRALSRRVTSWPSADRGLNHRAVYRPSPCPLSEASRQVVPPSKETSTPAAPDRTSPRTPPVPSRPARVPHSRGTAYAGSTRSHIS
ncbi:hypothetical protein [Streptomyces asiaticus]|uniref:hypothetical protein n=1 Tax=Streptomyces asiaticus TaxID=114695 RepID=UPI003F6805C6